jgi:hypothetical protein
MEEIMNLDEIEKKTLQLRWRLLNIMKDSSVNNTAKALFDLIELLEKLEDECDPPKQSSSGVNVASAEISLKKKELTKKKKEIGAVKARAIKLLKVANDGNLVVKNPEVRNALEELIEDMNRLCEASWFEALRAGRWWEQRTAKSVLEAAKTLQSAAVSGIQKSKLPVGIESEKLQHILGLKHSIAGLPEFIAQTKEKREKLKKITDEKSRSRSP